MDIRHAAYVKTPIVLAYYPKERNIPRKGLSIFKFHHFTKKLYSFPVSPFFSEKNGTKDSISGELRNNMSRFDPQVGDRLMVLEVGRLMTETSLYFIEANIFRGLSQLSRKTQLCVLLGRSRVWFSGHCVFCEKKQGIQFHKHLEQGVFLGPEAFKS